jgi:hypothetical protein
MIAGCVAGTTGDVMARTQPAIMAWTTSQSSWITP